MSRLIATLAAVVAITPFAPAQDNDALRNAAQGALRGAMESLSPAEREAAAEENENAAGSDETAQFADGSTTAEDFELVDLMSEDGEEVSLSDTLAQHPFAVIVWVSEECPIYEDYHQRIVNTANEYADRDIAFIGINSNATETDAAVIAEFRERGYTFPILRDTRNVVADQWGAQRTPEFFVVDREMNLRYHGRLDDNQDADGVRNRELRDALDALIEDNNPPVVNTTARGCTIKRAEG